MIQEASISTNGALSVDYTLHIAIGIIGAMIVFIIGIVGRHFIQALTKIETRLENHSTRIQAIEFDQEIEKRMAKKTNAELADLIVTKLRAAGG